MAVLIGGSSGGRAVPGLDSGRDAKRCNQQHSLPADVEASAFIVDFGHMFWKAQPYLIYFV
jgi:hypothetical protein